MEYEGIKLTEFKSDKPVVFNPARQMIVWDDNRFPEKRFVEAYIPGLGFPVILTTGKTVYCAELPDALKPRLARPCELSRWLAQGNGECMNKHNGGICTQLIYHDNTDFDFAIASYAIRKWDDDWHEPTVDYMGLEG